MLKTLVVIAIGFLPSLFSLWVMRKQRWQRRSQMRRYATTFSADSIRENTRSFPSDRYYLEGVGYLVGDISCQYNARSGYLRCAVNPEGPCENCRFYEQRQEVTYTKKGS